VRNGKTHTVTVTIGELPKDVASASGSDRGGAKGQHALAGITVENLSTQDGRFGRSTIRSGVVVTNIDADSPAAQAGLRTGDILHEINRKAVKDVRDFQRLTSELKPNMPVLVLLNRGKATIYLSIRGDR
jgi:serine protease Do